MAGEHRRCARLVQPRVRQAATSRATTKQGTCAVKDEPANEPTATHPRGKQNIVDDGNFNFFQYYDCSGHRRRY
jgi:hypothetical protein